MSLVYCPECGHEISANAIACPNCGRPISPPIVEKKFVVVPPARREGGIPSWAFIPIAILGLVLLFVLYIAMRGPDDATNTNINVKAARRETVEPTRETRTTTVPSTEGQTVTPPPPGQITTVPETITSAPAAPPPDKGSVTIKARVAPKMGSPVAARSAKFYLLDKDIETTLSEARIEPIEGNDLMSSLGLAVAFPDRFGDFMRRAMRAITAHSRYSGTTDVSGNVRVAGIVPKDYYLFGVTKVGRGFALWNAPIAVIAGENDLNLSPQTVVEIPQSSE